MAVVHPGKQENAFEEFCTQWLVTPALLVPHFVSVPELHDSLHHAPIQVPCAQAVHGEFAAVLHGSPMFPFVAAQIDPVVPPPIGWHVVPANGVQSALVEQPGKQMSTLLPFKTQKLVPPSELLPHAVAPASALHGSVHQDPLHWPCPFWPQGALVVVQGSPIRIDEPASPAFGAAAQTDSPTPVTGWHVALAKGRQSASVVQPGTHTSSPFAFFTQ